MGDVVLYYIIKNFYADRPPAGGTETCRRTMKGRWQCAAVRPSAPTLLGSSFQPRFLVASASMSTPAYLCSKYSSSACRPATNTVFRVSANCQPPSCVKVAAKGRLLPRSSSQISSGTAPPDPGCAARPGRTQKHTTGGQTLTGLMKLVCAKGLQWKGSLQFGAHLGDGEVGL